MVSAAPPFPGSNHTCWPLGDRPYLIVTDEAHRSIGGNARAVFDYFIGYKLGLTSKPMQTMLGVDSPDFAPVMASHVNVDGTAHVLDLCRSLPSLRRLQYVSTCYVSGRYDGAFTEEMLDEGQSFLNHYESTKFEAELLVRKAMADGVPATVYRPGIVVGAGRRAAGPRSRRRVDPTRPR